MLHIPTRRCYYHTPQPCECHKPHRPRAKMARRSPLKAWLVGSVAAGSPTPHDIDVVVTRSPKPGSPEDSRIRDLAVAHLSPEQTEYLKAHSPLRDAVQYRLATTSPPEWITFDPNEPTITLVGDQPLARALRVSLAGAIRYFLRHGQWPEWAPTKGEIPVGDDFDAAVTAAVAQGQITPVQTLLHDAFPKIIMGAKSVPSPFQR